MAHSDNPSAITTNSSDVRHRLLRAGRQILEDETTPAVVDLVRTVDVTRRAQVSSGSLYYHWQNHADYAGELADYVLDKIRADRASLLERHLKAFLAQILEDGHAFNDAVRLASEELFNVFSEGRSFSVQIGLWAAHGDRGTIDQRLREIYDKLEEGWTSYLVRILEAHSRKMRKPFDEKSFGASVIALTEGFLLRSKVDARAYQELLGDQDGDQDGAWGMFSASILAMYYAMTVPTDAPDSHVRDLGSTGA